MYPDDSHETDDRLWNKSYKRNFTTTVREGYRTPSLDNTTYMLVFLVVLIPIIFTLLLCAITYCIYRYNRSRTARVPTNSRIVPTDRSGAPIATVIYNNQHSPYTYEESPPSYDSLANMKKNSSGMITTNTDERIQSATLPNIGLTNSVSVVHPSAPTPPPPAYTNFVESNH